MSKSNKKNLPKLKNKQTSSCQQGRPLFSSPVRKNITPSNSGGCCKVRIKQKREIKAKSNHHHSMMVMVVVLSRCVLTFIFAFLLVVSDTYGEPQLQMSPIRNIGLAVFLGSICRCVRVSDYNRSHGNVYCHLFTSRAKIKARITSHKLLFTYCFVFMYVWHVPLRKGSFSPKNPDLACMA